MSEGLSFMEFVARIGTYAPASSTLSAAYGGASDHDEPHGVPWHTSFHASQAPWGERWCARKLVFDLLDAPSSETIDEEGLSIMEAGKDLETRYVGHWQELGVLVTAEIGDMQTNFVDREIWLSGSPDAGIVPIGWDRLHFVDVKGCDNENERKPKFKMLRSGTLEPDPKYVAQIQTYVNMAERDIEFTMKLAELGIAPAESGSVLYGNRARPHQRVEFFYEIDRDGYAVVRSRLAATRDFFLDEVLPAQPFGGKEWTEMPCRYCKYKRDVCKPLWKREAKEDVTFDLRQVAEQIQQIEPDYDYDDKRSAVLSRWNAEER